jgi:hypothetical protein
VDNAKRGGVVLPQVKQPSMARSSSSSTRRPARCSSAGAMAGAGFAATVAAAAAAAPGPTQRPAEWRNRVQRARRNAWLQVLTMVSQAGLRSCTRGSGLGCLRLSLLRPWATFSGWHSPGKPV